MSGHWTPAERRAALTRAERDGVDVLVIGGGITGAGVLRDAASRGLRALLVDRSDFASGTSSRSSKMIHGGIRYLAHGHFGVTREACRERDLLAARNPNLVRPLPFLFPTWEGGKIPPWQMRAALVAYAAVANFRRTARFRMLSPDQVLGYSRDIRVQGLRAAGLYQDAQVDDARLVMEALKSARRLGAEAANHAELIEFQRGPEGRLGGARVRDRLDGRTLAIRAGALVNAAGPGVQRVRGIDRPDTGSDLRPAKGVHLVIPRSRIHSQGAVTFEARDGRHLFLCPFGDVALIGTTDTFTDEIDEPVVTIEEVHYLLAAANEAFPRACLTTNDLRSVFAGVRPLVAPADAESPPSDVSREHEITLAPSGLLSLAGGKLTTFRAMGELAVDRVLDLLPRERRRTAGPSRTKELALRDDDFSRDELDQELRRRFALSPRLAGHLIATWGVAAADLLEQAAPEWRRPIGSSRYLYAELPWAIRTECPATLCDLLERRVRLALFAEGQGLPQLARIAEVAAEAAGWDAERAHAESAAYADAVRRRYQIVSRSESKDAA
ncbi:MAG TPA: glycerol-3-phosphate dehydrogenase/oxidase [Myxococcota bacterium]|nr:glycerol-3-phosphate dehydrogenase/oxidase [Myxococcota bacterium]